MSADPNMDKNPKNPDGNGQNVDESGTAIHGLQYGMAITACRIIACNKRVYLTEEARNGPRVEAIWDSIL
ncbi:hypothetical protein FRB96_001139 [Tulasnella sp. 330]|nr:hypothetical protein FRB96_001139 [Tulasnella sp. 330]